MNDHDARIPNGTRRLLVLAAMILIAAALRIAPHPWNFTPVGAMTLFSGALLRNKGLAFTFPLVALFAGDVFHGFHKLMPAVYASFLVSVAIGFLLRERRTVPRVGAATVAGAVQFFIVTNFADWLWGMTYPKTITGLLACYAAGIPFFWNTLTGDFFYSLLLFGGFALGEKFFPALRESSIKAPA